MKSIIRWPRVCTRCGSTEHFSEDCPLPTMLGLSDIERDIQAENRRDKQALLAVGVVLVLAQILISALSGVTP